MIIFKILILIILSAITIYFIYNVIYLICYNKKINNDKLKYCYDIVRSKVNKCNYVDKLNFYILELKKANENKYKYLSKYLINVISIIFSIIIFFISYYIFDIYSTAVLISCISFSIPYLIIQQLYLSNRQKILDNFPMYILTLKNYVYYTNDVILAFKKARIPQCLLAYINKFNISIEKGLSLVQAFDELKKNINIDIISDFLSSVLTCHLNGGNICMLLNKYAEMLTKINIKKAKRKQENLSSIIIFFILVIINIFLLFSFVYGNPTYKEIMTTNLIGKIIINSNILSYFIIFIVYKNIGYNG